MSKCYLAYEMLVCFTMANDFFFSHGWAGCFVPQEPLHHADSDPAPKE